MGMDERRKLMAMRIAAGKLIDPQTEGERACGRGRVPSAVQ
jgi:hypothetical protein